MILKLGERININSKGIIAKTQKYKFLIEWTSPCTYKLTLQKVKGKKSAKRFEGSVVNVEIVAVTNDSYTANSRTQDGKITIIEIEKAY